MELKKMQIKMLSCCFLAGGLTLAGCSTDDSIDVGEVDTTIGVKLNGFTVPLGKTENISIDDLFELKEGDCIRIQANGDYEFFQEGDDVTGANPKVDAVEFANPTSQTWNFKFTPSALSRRFSKRAPGDIQDYVIPEQTINAFTFTNPDAIKEVVKLEHASTSSIITLNLDFMTVATFASKVSLELQFPDFLELEINELTLPASLKNTYEYNKTTHKLSLPDIPTDAGLNGMQIKLLGLTNFKETVPATGDYIVVNPNTIAMKGQVTMSMKIKSADVNTSLSPADLTQNYEMKAGVSFASNITLTEATGYFNPTIELDDMGSIEIGDDVPDFLKDDEKSGEKNVDLRLTNPSITLGITNTIDARGIINGKMTATYENGKKKVININGMVVKPHTAATGNTKSTIVICRDKSAFPQDQGYQFIEKNSGDEDLASLLNEIPDKIEFTCTAGADQNYKGTIKLGTSYSIQPSYSFSAPLSLQPDSKIVYDDKVDGFYEDIEDNDIDFRGQAELEILGKMTNNTPLSLVLESTAVDVNGNAIPGITLTKSNVIKSNLDGSKATELKITLTKNPDVDLKKVKFDGIKFKAKATSVDATTLNKDKHSIKVEDLKISITSEVSIDADKKKDDKK